MATISKNTTATLAGTGWVGGTVPGTDDIALIGSDASGLANITSWGVSALDTSATEMSSSFTGTRLDMDTASTSARYRLYNVSTARVNGIYSLYVADNKTLGIGQVVQLRGPTEERAVHRWYIGAGGGFILNPINATDRYGNLNASVGAGLALRIVKEGPGYAYVSRSSSALPAITLAGGFTIRDGSIYLDGFTSADPLGVSVAGVNDSHTLIFDPDSVAAQPTLRFLVNQTTARTVPNPVTVNTRGTITAESGFTATMTGAAAGTGTLTIGGAGNVAWNNNIACSLQVDGLLTMGLNNRIGSVSGLTISGGGTIAMNNGDLGADSAITATGHTGAITGTCTIKGGVSDFASDFQGTVTIGGGIITLRGASIGSVASVGNFSTLTVRNTISGGGGGSTTLNGNGTLNFAAAGKFADTRIIAATATTTIGLSEAASIASPINATDTSTITLRTTDTTTNTYSGTLNSSGASGTTKVMALTDGTLILSGSVTGAAGRTYNLNADSGYAGTIRVTGSGFTTSSVTLSRGKLDLNRVGSIGLGGGLTAATNATVACYSTGAYAAQLTGNLTLSAGAIMKFGTA